MGWIIRHSRVGNAQSLYAVERTEDNLTALSDSVKGGRLYIGQTHSRRIPLTQQVRGFRNVRSFRLEMPPKDLLDQ